MTRWFGQSWDAPACHPDYEVPVPQGENCGYCHHPFDSDSQGVILGRGDEQTDMYHQKCHTILICGPEVAEFIERTKSGEQDRRKQEAPVREQEDPPGSLPRAG